MEDHPHNANFVVKSDHTGYNASADSFRGVHVAIHTVASHYTVGILSSSRSNMMQKYVQTRFRLSGV